MFIGEEISPNRMGKISGPGGFLTLISLSGQSEEKHIGEKSSLSKVCIPAEFLLDQQVI